MIRTLIIDDEMPARRHIRRLLETWPEVTIVGEASDGRDALDQLKALGPDLVFLDVQMPEMSGLEVVAAVGADLMPVTVFTTAHDAYALQAFEAQALDYLLKPFDDRRFDAALKRALKQLSQKRLAQAATAQPHPLAALRLVARSQGRTRLVALDEVDWIGVAGDYAEAHLGQRTVLLDGSLASLLDKLPADQFARVHRTAIVRIDRLSEIKGSGHGDAWLTLRDGTRLKLSRRYRENLAAWSNGHPLGGN
jgi:two-component system LytT family response regulator